MLADAESFGGRADDAFDVVVPDLPGYGFPINPRSTGPSFGSTICGARLMTDKLGYAQFGAHGGELG
jgi:pimeloyl-ACP methyl ester carboxylesterase